MTKELLNQLDSYDQWRDEVADAVETLRTWLEANEVSDAQFEMRLQFIKERLQDNRFVVAFVAEFSRGKSELINAIFFADQGDRILPSGTGRTTMCPTELEWTPDSRPELRLLPIDTREKYGSVAELKRQPDLWTIEPLHPESRENLKTTLNRVKETKRVTVEEARSLGFTVGTETTGGLYAEEDGQVEIPSWRHAVVNFPHPMLEKGLVILDMPGLNAIGAEPELTVSLLPNAHAVMFVLGIDTGVTQSDLAVWQSFGNGDDAFVEKGRMVVLNKIDGLWDGLRNEHIIESEIFDQVQTVSKMLHVPTQMVFPVSAQKGLVAKITSDEALLERSRLPALEQALSNDLLATRQEIVRDRTLVDVDSVVRQTRELFEARLRGVREQLKDLRDLRGKNRSVIEYMMQKIRNEKVEFEKGLQQYYAVRSVFSTLTNNLLQHLGMETLRIQTHKTREAMLDSAFSKGLRQAMQGFFVQMRHNLSESTQDINEITQMLDNMYRRFRMEHGLCLAQPQPFSVLRYEKELNRLERAFDRQFNSTLALVTTEKRTLTHKFFETVAVQARRTFEVANRDVDVWLRAVMSPLETQIREYQLQLKRRLESVKRIYQATGTLDTRLEELQASEKTLIEQTTELARCADNIYAALKQQGEEGAVQRRKQAEEQKEPLRPASAS